METLALPAMVAERLVRDDMRVVVTGASGWLGQAALEMLSGAYGASFTARVRCFGSAARTLKLRGGQLIGQQPLHAMADMEAYPTVLLHFACLTREKVIGMRLAEYVATNRAISLSTYEAAVRIGVEWMFLVSSGAVYAAMAAPLHDQPYGTSKMEAEAFCNRFAHEREGRRVAIARLFNLSGPHINKPYALASFIEQARAARVGASIKISAANPVIRSYVGVENLITVALSHLLSETAEPHVCFDTAGERAVEIQELAETVKRLVNPSAGISRPAFGSAQTDRYVGDGSLFRALASRRGVVLHDLDRQVKDTAAYMSGSVTS